MKPLTVMRVGLAAGMATFLVFLVAWDLSGWQHELALILVGVYVSGWYDAAKPFSLPLLRWIRRRL